MSTAKPRVGVYFSQGWSFSRDILPGITNYAYNVGNWEIVPHSGPLVEFKSQDLDGIIGIFVSEREIEHAKSLAPRIVSYSNNPTRPGLVRVISDDRAVGRLAAEYLIGRGFRSFGISGIPDHNYSDERLGAFTEVVRDQLPQATISERHNPRGFREWLRSLPKPAAVFACNDNRASAIVNAAIEEGIAVPSELAVLGVDNDEVVCALSRVPLSSIVLACRKIGFEAAKTLDLWIREGKTPPPYTRIAPAGVNTRTSTDSIAVADPVVAAALQYIRANAFRELLVTEVAKGCGVGRRTLERKFKESLASSPHDEIQRLRLDRAKKLLVETDLSVDEVAVNAGFTTARILSATFRKLLGQTPTAYKRQMQLV